MDTIEKAQNLPYISASPGFSLSKAAVYSVFFKRLLDIALCLLLLPIVLPLLAILMICIKLDSRGPAVYRSERIGKNGKKFNCLKLRTMCVNAHERLTHILNENPELDKEYSKYRKLKNDPRVTRIGKILRSCSLDEIPQILNVLKGDMSFVGPRPAFEEEIPNYGSNYYLYKSVRPGITGLWQVNGRSETSFSTRVQMDTNYVKRICFSNDIKILLKTIPAAITQKGAY